MFDACAGVHMASDQNWIARSRAVAEKAGFGENYPYLGIDDIARRARKTPVQFLFCHYELEDSVLAQTVSAIRNHSERDVRFMPIIVFSKESSTASLKHFLKMGFDDIVIFPCELSYFISRLGQQISRKLDYFSVGTYFGPDRRRLLADEPRADNGAGGSYTQYVVQRDPAQGVRILSQSQHGAKLSA